MLLRILFFVVCLMGTLQSRAQAYEPALLVRSNGDTLRGEIENSFWTEPPKIIRYRRTPASGVETFQPRQLRAVNFVNGRHFRYMGLPIDNAAETRLQRLPRGYRPDIRIDSVLADVLVDGAVSLLRVITPGSPHYLLLRAGRLVLDLCERQYLIQQQGQSWALMNGNNYKGQLAVYFAECPLASGAAQNARFTAEGLAAVVQAHNTTCDLSRQPSNNWLANTKPARFIAFQGGLIAGVNYFHSEFIQNAAFREDAVRPFAGIYSDLLLPNRRFMLYAELNASTYSGLGSEYFTVINSGIYNSFTYRVWLATVRLGVHYSIHLPHDQQLLLGIGYEVSKITDIAITTISGPPTTYRAGSFEPLPLALPSIGLGWRKQRISLGLYGQVYPSNDNTALSIVASSNFAARLNLGYRLGRAADARPSSLPLDSPTPAPAGR